MISFDTSYFQIMMLKVSEKIKLFKEEVPFKEEMV
jgi:hypothetical protein